MGFYLNNAAPGALYKSETESPYFVDKSQLLEELIPFVQQGNKHICITRPRRFGKTVMANMIGAFFGKGSDTQDIFDALQISSSPLYKDNLNHYNLIYIDFSKMPAECSSYTSYISRIEKRLKTDLLKDFPDVECSMEDALWDILDSIFDVYHGQKFLFVMDEWDYIFHRDFILDKDRKGYLQFLSNLLKDHAYVSMSYMTGILPISKYSSGSELNMFMEFKMTSMEIFGEYFGFTDEEVDVLYDKYLHLCKDPQVSRDGLREWYDGYFTASGRRLYNPRSVVMALRFNQLSNYWTSSGPYDEIFYYIRNDIEHIRDDLALMISGEGIDARVEREDKAGHSPEEAIWQIREKQYALRFRGKPGEKERYTGQILGVGISYDKDTKEHHCKIEQL